MGIPAADMITSWKGRTPACCGETASEEGKGNTGSLDGPAAPETCTVCTEGTRVELCKAQDWNEPTYKAFSTGILHVLL